MRGANDKLVLIELVTIHGCKSRLGLGLGLELRKTKAHAEGLSRTLGVGLGLDPSGDKSIQWTENLQELLVCGNEVQILDEQGRSHASLRFICRESVSRRESLRLGLSLRKSRRSCRAIKQVLGGLFQKEDGIANLAISETLECSLCLIWPGKLYNGDGATRRHQKPEDLAVRLKKTPEFGGLYAEGEILHQNCSVSTFAALESFNIHSIRCKVGLGFLNDMRFSMCLLHSGV